MTPPPRAIFPFASSQFGSLHLLFAAVLFLALFSPVHAQEEPQTRDDRRQALLDGTHVLRRILFDHGVRPLEDVAALRDDPSRTILIVLGDLDLLAQTRDGVRGGLETFVRRGGAVLLAGDRAVTDDTAAEELLSVSGVLVSRESYHSPRVSDAYHGLSYCPRVRPRDSSRLGFLSSTGAIDDYSLNVFTNVPAKLRRQREFPGEVRPELSLPPGSLLELPGGFFRTDDELAPLFGVAGTLGEGRVVVLADHSLFINQMMLPRDNNNVEFSYNLVRWLRGEGGKRDRALFIENGTVQSRFDIPLRSVDIPPEEVLKLLFARRNELLVEGERALARLEEQDFFNRRLFDGLDAARLTPQRLILAAIFLGTLALALYLFYRLGIRGRFRHDPTVAPLTNALGRTAPVQPLLRQRREVLLQTRNLFEPAAQLVRRWFVRLGVDPADGDPPFVIRGPWWQRWWLRRQLRALLRLARGRGDSRITPGQLGRLQRELDHLLVAFQRGDWQFGPTAALSTPLPRSGAQSQVLQR